MVDEPLAKHFYDLTLADGEVVGGFIDADAPALKVLFGVVFVDVRPFFEDVDGKDGAHDVVDLEIGVIIERVFEIDEAEGTNNPGLDTRFFLDFANNRFGDVFVALNAPARKLRSSSGSGKGFEHHVKILAFVLAPDNRARAKHVAKRKLFVDGKGLVGDVGFNVFDFQVSR